MHLRLIFLTIAAFCFCGVFSQKLIPQFGLTLPSISLDSGPKPPPGYQLHNKQLTGVMAGMVVESSIAKNLHFQSGLIYTQKGHKWITEYITNTYTRFNETLRLNYVEMPLLLRWSVRKAKIDYYLRAGPALDWFIGGKYELNLYEDLKNGDPPVLASTDASVVHRSGHILGYDGDHFYLKRRFDIGLYVGAGMRIAERWCIDLGYTRGFVNASDYYFGANRVLQVSVGTLIKW